MWEANDWSRLPRKDKTMAKAKQKTVKKAEGIAIKEDVKIVNDLIKDEQIAEAIIIAEEEISIDDKKEEHKTIAKAGKRSAKAIKEAEGLAAKEARKAQKNTESEISAKQTAPKTRTKLERAGKKLQEVTKLIDKTKEYSLGDALALAVKTNPAKFDATVEIHVNLGVDPRHADQNIRANLVLPSGTGKPVRVAVFGEADDIANAKKAGADIAASDEFLQQLDKETINFDVLIATPKVMAKLAKYARLLGPKGLMPSPKSGTVTTDIAKAVQEAKAGRVEYRVDSNGIVHLGFGKVSFGVEKLSKNAMAVLSSIKAAKPANIKGSYVKSIYITTSMGPSIKVTNNSI